MACFAPFGSCVRKDSINDRSATDGWHSNEILDCESILKYSDAGVKLQVGTNICSTALILDAIDGHVARIKQKVLRVLGLRQVEEHAAGIRVEAGSKGE